MNALLTKFELKGSVSFVKLFKEWNNTSSDKIYDDQI